VYRPRDLLVGLTISGVTALALLIACRPFRLKAEAAKSKEVQPVASAFSRNDGFTLIELMVVMAILGIILAIAFARYHNMQARGNEASAIASMRSIAAAQWAFAQTCGNQKYAPTLPALGQPVPSTGASFLSPDLTGADVVEKSGYQFRIAAKPLDEPQQACNGVTVSAGYAATADPMKPGVTGDRFFGINTDRVLHEDTQTFTENMPETGAPPHGTEVK
jgi:prepilin-type N-terminal cleavage/methylation domain-containing protein